MYKRITYFAVIIVLGGFSLAALAALDDDIHGLQHDWAVAKYQTDKDKQDAAFAKLEQDAANVVQSNPGRAEPLIWQAIITSTHAGVNGGLGALSLVKQARALLEKAESINADALDGSVYTSLGSLYYQVPGWPLGFGDDDKAEQYLKKALAANPSGIDSNYFYADFLLDQGRYKEAEGYFNKAANAPDRPDRPIADAGRRQEIRDALKKLAELKTAEASN